MSFEAEVIPLFIGGVSVISILELVFGCIVLQKQKKARNRLVGHAVCMAIAQVFLIRCIFANRLDIEVGIESIFNSVNVGLFGVFWAISVFFLMSMVVVSTEKRK